MEEAQAIESLIARWSKVGKADRARCQPFTTAPCTLLNLPEQIKAATERWRGS